jgi:methionine synthase II (cobalamin-independent)
MQTFQADCRCLLIGSLPLRSHREAADLVFKYTPAIPIWVQLPALPRERMIPQFMPGLPGLAVRDDDMFIDTSAADFDQQVLDFYQEYLAVVEGGGELDHSRFAMDPETAEGFHVLLERLPGQHPPPSAVKGQITGPFTFGTGVVTEQKRAVFYDPQYRDVCVKHLALKAKWQIRNLAALVRPVIIFCDEPALAGFGTSEYISISREEVGAALNEVIDAVHAEGALAGVHVCANTDWSLILESDADIVNFDAYSYFDRFVLYAEAIKKFVAAGKILALGIVPTGSVEDIEKETADSLFERLTEQFQVLEKLGIPRRNLLAQSLLTPSCGAGSLPPVAAERVLQMTRELSERMRSEFVD